MKYNNVLNVLRGLTFFERNHSNGTPVRSWTLAAYHHPHSLTWRWGIWYSMRKAGKTGFYFMRVYRSQGFNFHAGINIPLLGSVSIQTQPHMWNKRSAGYIQLNRIMIEEQKLREAFDTWFGTDNQSILRTRAWEACKALAAYNALEKKSISATPTKQDN